MAMPRLFVIISVAALIVNAVKADVPSNTRKTREAKQGKASLPSPKEECAAEETPCPMPLEVLNLAFLLDSTILKPCPEGGYKSESEAVYRCMYDHSITFNSNCTKQGKWNPNVLDPVAISTLPACSASDFVAGSIWLVLSAIFFINM